MYAGILGRLYDIALCNGTVKEGDVFRNASRDEEDVLIHRCERTLDCLAGELPPGYSIERQRSAPLLIKTGNDFRQSGLPAS